MLFFLKNDKKRLKYWLAIKIGNAFHIINCGLNRGVTFTDEHISRVSYFACILSPSFLDSQTEQSFIIITFLNSFTLLRPL